MEHFGEVGADRWKPIEEEEGQSEVGFSLNSKPIKLRVVDSLYHVYLVIAMRFKHWLGLVALLLALYVLWQIRQLALLVFTAIVLATAINQLVMVLQRLKLKRTPAVLMSIGIVILFLSIAVLLVVPPFVDQFQDLINLLPFSLERIEQGIEWLNNRTGEIIPEVPGVDSLLEQLQLQRMNLLQRAIAVLILYIAIQNIESYWLTPTVMAKQVALLPAITLTSQLFFASIFGPLGLVMAIPLTVVAKIWIEEALFKDVLDPWRGNAAAAIDCSQPQRLFEE